MGLIAATMVAVERETFCLLVVVAEGTFDLLAATTEVSEVGTFGLVAATMLTVEREAFCLLVVTAGGTFDLLAAIMEVSEVGKLWSGSNIRARRMLSSAAVRSLGLNPVDRLSRGLVEGVSWAVTY